MLDCLSRCDLVLEIKHSCEVSLSRLSYKLTQHLRSILKALNMAYVNHAARHHSRRYAFVLFPDAYWQLKKAQLESSHSLVSRVNALAERTVVSAGPGKQLAAPGRWQQRELSGWACWLLLAFDVTLPEIMPVASSGMLLESVALGCHRD